LITHGRDHAFVVREDLNNPRVLYAGTDAGVFVSLDLGQHWAAFNSGLPTVSVRDLAVHPRDHELIAATHGRSVWIVDISPFSQLETASRMTTASPLAPPVLTEYEEPYHAGLNGYVNGNRPFAQPTPSE